MSLIHSHLGFGLGLRTSHYQTIINDKPDVDWFEIISENFLVPGGRPWHYLDQIRVDYPIVMHGVSLSIGSTDPLDRDYLNQLKQLIKTIQPPWVSDHLCWTNVGGHNTHDLMPMPYTEEALSHVVNRVKQVQDFLGQRILLENPSSYVAFADSSLSEWEFMAELAKQADCLLLLDINNIYVSSFNHNFDSMMYLNAMPVDRVQQFHLAGHYLAGDFIIDTHDAPIIDPVFDLYAQALKRFGEVSVMIERDDNIPPLDELIEELDKVKQITNQFKLEQVSA